MAIGIDNVADNLQFSTSAPSGDVSFSIRLYITTTPAANSCICSIGSNSSNGSIFLYVTSGLVLHAYVNETTDLAGSTLVTGQWYAIQFKGNTGSGQAFAVRLDGVNDITGNSGTTAYIANQTMLGINFFGDRGIFGRYESWKLWNAQLSDAELDTERTPCAAVRTANLWQEVRLLTNTDTNDSSGNGRNFAVNGTLTTETGTCTSGGPSPNLFETVTLAENLTMHMPIHLRMQKLS